MDQQDAQNRQINYEKNIELISEYHMGDIVWAKLVGCQFWPAMVTKDPLCSLFVKGNGRNRTYALHVRFCKFYGRRSWVTIVEKYCSEQDLVSKHPDYMYSSEKDFSEMVLWHEAVKVADHLSTLHPK
ncbi:PWWP domain [Cinara cedri]|uniref:PWWP domain n=1 Tax=Cinara cedri TaxID=506608 RepID=A0A5E4M8H2_9HEMI|nr:PWWP domain [Cinara cedri]